VVSVWLSAIAVLAAAVSAIIPGILIQLCMMPEMTCRSVFRPVDVACSVFLLIVAAIRFFAVLKDKTI
jgi:hypothetical protein